jgi:hypothetical protein
MVAFHHRASAADLVTQSSDEFLHRYALANADFTKSAIDPAGGFRGRAGAKIAMENDVNSFIALQPLNLIETRLFHGLFDDIYDCTPMIDFAASMATLPVERLLRQIQSGGQCRSAADDSAGRRAA